MRRWHCNTGKCHSLKDNRCRPCRASWWRRRALVDTVGLEWAEWAELALEVASDAQGRAWGGSVAHLSQRSHSRWAL